MAKSFVFSIPAGIYRTQQILDLNQRLKDTGKPVSLRSFDQVHGLQWNGGRLIFNTQSIVSDGTRFTDVNVDNMDEGIERVLRLNEAGIPFNIAFNNTMEGINLEDKACNRLLEKLHNGMNGVTLATEALRKHVRTNYPKYDLTCSQCFAYTRLSEVQEACDNYEEVVLMPVMAYDAAYEEGPIRDLPMDKLIPIVNDICYLFCLKKDHWDYLSRCNLYGNTSVEEQQMNLDGVKCFPHEVPGYRKKVRDESDYARNARISKLYEEHLKDPVEATTAGFGLNFNLTGITRRKLIERGIRHFKLQGREMDDYNFQTKVLDFVERMVQTEIPDDLDGSPIGFSQNTSLVGSAS